MIFVSPQPNTWYKIWVNLKAIWVKNKMTCLPPPTALVLSSWTMSNDYDKLEQWQQTIKWVDTNKLTHLLSDLNDDEKYCVEELSYWRPFQNHNFHPEKYKPTIEEIQTTIQTIKNNWVNYVDNEFANNTKPLKLTGKKSRRLIVKVDKNYQPHWGTWTKINSDKKEIFSNSRKHINSNIKPLEIDHIDFI